MPFQFNTDTGEFEEINEKKKKGVIELSDSTTVLIKGDKGEKGDKGDSITGPVGPRGEIGERGPEGKIGPKGESITGAIGPIGPVGPKGDSITGPPGKDGRDGLNGNSAPLVELGKSATHFQWRYKDGEWQDLAPLVKGKVVAGGIHYIKDASDVNIKGITNGQVPVWNSTQRKFIPGAGGGSGHTIEDEGTPLTARSKLNFVGAGVEVTDDSGDDATVVTINGGGSDVPLSFDVTYTGDQITEVAFTGGNTYTIAYNVDGTINTLNDGTYTTTMGYTGDKLTSGAVT